MEIVPPNPHHGRSGRIVYRNVQGAMVLLFATVGDPEPVPLYFTRAAFRMVVSDAGSLGATESR